MSYPDELLVKIFGKQRRVMRSFALDEISAVTTPAQKGAKMVIMKADTTSRTVSDDLAKGRMQMTTPVNGHAHLIDLDDFAILQGGGFTLPSGSSSDGVASHRHPFIVGGNGEITIGEADGHVHRVETSTTTKGTDDMQFVTQSSLAKAMLGDKVGKGLIGEAVSKLDELAAARAEKTGEPFAEAYSKVLLTRQGADLYEQTV